MSSFAQGLVDEYLSPSIKKVIGHQHYGYSLEQLTAHVFPAQPFLQFTKGKYHFIISWNKLSINDYVTRQRSKWLNQLRKPVSDFVHGPRVNRDSSVLYVGLSPNAIKLVFY